MRTLKKSNLFEKKRLIKNVSFRKRNNWLRWVVCYTLLTSILVVPTVLSDNPNVQILSTYPANGTTELLPDFVTFRVNITHTNGSVMNITWWSNLSDRAWDYFYLDNSYVTLSNRTNGSWSIDTEDFFCIYNYTYYWNISISDEDGTNTTGIFHFTTAANPFNYSSNVATPIIPSYAWIVGVVMSLSAFGIIAFIKQKKRY
jgi:hypothetical protein